MSEECGVKAGVFKIHFGSFQAEEGKCRNGNLSILHCDVCASDLVPYNSGAPRRPAIAFFIFVAPSIISVVH